MWLKKLSFHLRLYQVGWFLMLRRTVQRQSTVTLPIDSHSIFIQLQQKQFIPHYHSYSDIFAASRVNVTPLCMTEGTAAITDCT